MSEVSPSVLHGHKFAVLSPTQLQLFPKLVAPDLAAHTRTPEIVHLFPPFFLTLS